MKELSDWPTFPQLFIKGEFVGGADIVRQMHESGELEKKLGSVLPPAQPPAVTVTPRAAAELQAALKDGGPGDVIHLTITPSWEHQLDIGPKEATHVTVETTGITLQLDRASAAKATNTKPRVSSPCCSRDKASSANSASNGSSGRSRRQTAPTRSRTAAGSAER